MKINSPAVIGFVCAQPCDSEELRKEAFALLKQLGESAPDGQPFPCRTDDLARAAAAKAIASATAETVSAVTVATDPMDLVRGHRLRVKLRARFDWFLQEHLGEGRKNALELTVMSEILPSSDRFDEATRVHDIQVLLWCLFGLALAGKQQEFRQLVPLARLYVSGVAPAFEVRGTPGTWSLQTAPV